MSGSKTDKKIGTLVWNQKKNQGPIHCLQKKHVMADFEKKKQKPSKNQTKPISCCHKNTLKRVTCQACLGWNWTCGDWDQIHLPCLFFQWSKWDMSAFQNTWISTSCGVWGMSAWQKTSIFMSVWMEVGSSEFRKRDFPRLLLWKWGRSGFQKQWIGSCQFSWNVKFPVRFGGNWSCLVSQKSGDPWPFWWKLGLAGLYTKWHSMSGWVGIGHLQKPRQPNLQVRFDDKWACPDWSVLTSLFWNKREETGWMGSTRDGCGWGVSSYRWWGGYQKGVCWVVLFLERFAGDQKIGLCQFNRIIGDKLGAYRLKPILNTIIQFGRLSQNCRRQTN